MKIIVSRWFIGLALLNLTTLDAARAAADTSVGLILNQGWTSQTTKPRSLARGFFTIHNASAAPDLLTRVTCPIAQKTVIRNAQHQNVQDVPIAAGQTIRFTPAGMHLVLEHTHFRFYRQADIPCNAMFRDAGTLMVYLHVEAATASSYHHAGAARPAATE